MTDGALSTPRRLCSANERFPQDWRWGAFSTLNGSGAKMMPGVRAPRSTAPETCYARPLSEVRITRATRGGQSAAGFTWRGDQGPHVGCAGLLSSCPWSAQLRPGERIGERRGRLQGQEPQLHRGSGRRRRLRPICAHPGAASGTSSPRQSQHRRAEHDGRCGHARHQLAL